jgi:hypothetical protein
MKLALVIYAAFLAIEGGLAWLVSGNPFLLAAVTCGVLFYASVWKQGAAWGELVRALAAGLIAVAGPLYYKASLLPTLLCFLALPHLLAATQCFWEIALGKDPAPQNVRMRTVVFTVAFYAAMGLVFVLLRGAESVSSWITGPLAILVLVLAIPAWDLARVTRLKPGRPARGIPLGVSARRIVLVLAVLGAIAALFSGVLPAAAEKLCEVSPRWRLKADAPGQSAPRENKPEPQPDASGPAQRPGLDSSAITGRHQLPEQADIRATGASVLYVRPHSPAQAARMAESAVYVRSHTLDDWKDGAWTPSVQGGKWLEDSSDGTTDGVITLRPAGASAIPHTVFLENADGYTLPALQNVTALHLPRVYALPGDVHQMQTGGPIRYDAVSAPLNWESLPDRVALRAGNTGNAAQSKIPDNRAVMDLVYGEAPLHPERTMSLAQRVEAMHAWFGKEVRYSTVVKGGNGVEPLDNFLTAERRGYCDFYATAAALMLRFYGVPTRVAYGYAGRTLDEPSGVFIFTDDSAHAWTEVFLEGHGWTICDFTPPGNIGQLGGEQERPQPAFDEKQFAEQKDNNAAGQEEKKPEEFSLSTWWKDTMAKIAAMDPMERTKQVLTWLAVAAVLYFLLRLMRHREGGEDEGPDPFAEDEKQPPYYAEFLRVFHEAGLPRRQGSTPREHLAAVRRQGLAGAEFDPMMHYHYSSRYAEAGRDAVQEQAFVAVARAAEQRLRQSSDLTRGI